jgi:hypothetical protein
VLLLPDELRTVMSRKACLLAASRKGMRGQFVAKNWHLTFRNARCGMIVAVGSADGLPRSAAWTTQSCEGIGEWV